MSDARRYCLITPCRDEAQFAQRTLDAIDAQSVKPARWVLVDDGSTDATPRILAAFAADRPWVTVITREDRGERKVGPGVIDTFYVGYDSIDPAEFAYVCKFDLDLDIGPRYFERLMELMEADARLGTVSGKPFFPPEVLRGQEPPTREALLTLDAQGRRDALGAGRGTAFEVSGLVSEACGDEMSVGMTKFYRTRCFEQIGGFVRQVMWDGIDCHRCRMLGWKAGSVDEPELRFVHLRPMGSSHKGILTGRMRHGFGQAFMGTSLAYMTASAAFRTARPPLVVGGAAMWWGYVSSRLRRDARYDDPCFRRFLRRYQWDCLIRGKAGATRRLDHQGEPRWTPPS